MLIVAALVSLALGIHENPSTGWIEGFAILVAVSLVVTVGATNDYQKVGTRSFCLLVFPANLPICAHRSCNSGP